MEVTKGNFPGVLQEVQFLLTRSSLVAFDCEFTGLRSSGVREAWEDTPDERYCKLKRGSSEFALIQYGVCFFVQDDTSNLKFEAHPFNFYLFPSYPLGRRIPKRLDRRFCCQASSLVMLASFGLDFNKWIREGVPYLRESDELWWKEGRSKAGEPSQDELNQFIGFSQVFKMIVESKIPLVGHSILLDLLHSYTHFIDDLPEALMTFKEELHKRLSSLYDTQLICENDKIRPLLGASTSLANLYSSLTQPQFPLVTMNIPASCEHYASGKYMHEAAYDAYISGCAFLLMARILGGENTTDPFEALDKYKNRVYLFNCESADYLNLTGPETPALRNHIFHLTFSKEVTTDDIKNLFSPFGGCHVSWISNTNARVSLHHRQKANEAYKALGSEGAMCGKPFTITPHESLMCSGADKPVLQQEIPVRSYTPPLGKRKTQEDGSLSEDNAPPSAKVQMFEENTDW